MGVRGRKPGTPKTGGRRKGTPNKQSKDTVARLLESGCDPLAKLQEIAKKAENPSAADLKKGVVPDLNLAYNCYKELAHYVAPKRKAIELSGDQENPVQHNHKIQFTIKE